MTLTTAGELQADAIPANGRRGGLIVLCAGNNYDDIKVADHHMAERLAERAPVQPAKQP
jgi:hypothetical protein